jgi:hypothetical protein
LKNSLIGNSNIREVSTNLAPFPLYPFYASRPASRMQAPNITLIQMFVVRPITSFPEAVTTM